MKEGEGENHKDTWEESSPGCGNSKCKTPRQEFRGAREPAAGGMLVEGEVGRGGCV